MLENTETNMSGVQLARLTGRATSSKDAGTEVETDAVPGQQERAFDPQEGETVYHRVPDARRLPEVLEDAVR